MGTQYDGKRRLTETRFTTWDRCVQTYKDGLSLTRAPLLPDRPSEENGFWRARKRARNQQVSAILLVEGLMPWSVALKTPVLWHNPWAERPLDPNIWQGPQMIPNMDASEPYMQERVGKKGLEIFHLQPGEENI